ncbi:hypothetical protein HMPREF9709_00004 [Helcococcus kunzii ATCC 51366]|uniref:DUF2620 domain-containing protein n=2 Tax=Helcococcus kunzii TaxID=40091 RepID=H3NKZ3_9FIRM|nr:DUF2620 family protein [Helcococcus kunzii]EHR36417.1 hypothetical protein HMPREF9709_00004 [Helcococcus kunzii ATCC 51366]
MDKQDITNLVKELVKGKMEVESKSDIEAVLDIQSNKADYYLGACATGAGGALGIATGMLGRDKCVSVSIPGKKMTEEEIKMEIENGKIAFGFVNYDYEKVVPIILKYILDK